MWPDDQPYFPAHQGQLQIRWPESREPSLRRAQIGALFSLAGHLATGSEPGQAVLPTGVGKTAVICALPFLLPTTRVLVVVPTRLLRDQLAAELGELSTLRRVGAVAASSPNPKVKRVEHRLATSDEWQDLQGCDVAVGTPGVLSGHYEGVAPPPRDLFDLMIFDEAHHLPAATWTGMLREHDARVALVTATPFRRDRKLLPGRLVFHYSLRQAMQDDVYRPVQFTPVVGAAPDDRDIAVAATARQRAEPHASEGSLLLVRTDRVAHAEELVELYESLGVRVGLITAQHSARHARRVLDQLRSGELAGVVSVGALVEGIDLPALKIAAYHRPHRSLAPTLQFVGRIARVTGGTAPAELVAVPREIAGETAELYGEDAAWVELLPKLVDAAVDRERATREYVSELKTDGPDEISASALRPRRMAQVYRTTGMMLHVGGDFERLGGAPVIFRVVDESATLTAIITRRRVRPEWLASDSLDTFEYQLYMAVHDVDRGMLFVDAPSDATSRELLALLGANDAPRVSPQVINRWLWSHELLGYSSVGMRSARASAASRASYRTAAGTAVQGALLPSESRSYGVGHLIGRRRTNGTTGGVGVSIGRSKIWETAACDSLLSFREWCADVAERATGSTQVGTTAPGLALPMPEELTRFPDRPLAVVVDHRLVQGEVDVFVPGLDWVHIATVEPQAQSIDGQQMCVVWGYGDSEIGRTILGCNGAVTATQPVRARVAGAECPLEDLLTEFPPHVYFGDGSSCHGSVLLMPPAELPPLPSDLIEAWDFADTDIRAESDPPRQGKRYNVQQRTVAWAKDNLSSPVLIVDDAAYEIADVIAIEYENGVPRVHFFHCKFSSKDFAGNRLADLYEVLGQAVRSARWTNVRACWDELARRVRERAATRVEGRPREEVAAILTNLVGDLRGLDLRVWAVQPGLLCAGIAGWQEGETMLLAAKEWCEDQGAILRVAGNTQK